MLKGFAIALGFICGKVLQGYLLAIGFILAFWVFGVNVF